jgi:hypothetical protein
LLSPKACLFFDPAISEKGKPHAKTVDHFFDVRSARCDECLCD